MKVDSADYGEAAEQLPRKRSGKAAEAAANGDAAHENGGRHGPAAAAEGVSALDDDDALPGVAHATPAWAAAGTRIAKMQGGSNGACTTGSGGGHARRATMQMKSLTIDHAAL